MTMSEFDAVTAIKVLNAFVPVSRFNKGEAGKIIDEVKQDGIRVIVKNNVPECIMITVDEYNRLSEAANRSVSLIQNKDEDAKRKAFIQKIRTNVQPPVPAVMSVADAIQKYGPIDIDEDAVNELRRISTI